MRACVRACVCVCVGDLCDLFVAVSVAMLCLYCVLVGSAVCFAASHEFTVQKVHASSSTHITYITDLIDRLIG